MLSKEERIVDQVFRANKEACDFYHTAQYKAANSQLAQTFARLEELHKIALQELQKKLHIRMQGTERTKENIIPISLNPEEEAVRRPMRGIDAILLKHMKERQQACILTVKKALNARQIHILNRIFLKNLLYLLQERYELEGINIKC